MHKWYRHLHQCPADCSFRLPASAECLDHGQNYSGNGNLIEKKNIYMVFLQLEKKNTSEFTTIENTIEIHSLQLVGFLFSVCHTVLFVQVKNNNCTNEKDIT